MRYKFYRPHKYVSFAMSDLERLIAKADFTKPDQLAQVETAFNAVMEMFKDHAEYENNVLHALLRKKSSLVYEKIEADHHAFDTAIDNLHTLLQKIKDSVDDEAKVEAGYQFYLWFRKLVGENLLHLHDEETIILPELQRLYSEDFLRDIKDAAPEKFAERLKAIG